MALILLLSASSSLTHETPRDRIAISRVIRDGEWVSETHSLPTGDLILFTFASPHGVLSMASHTGYVIYVGLTPIAGGPTEWFRAPESNSGVFNFGPNTATIEIVATSSTSITYTAYYLGFGQNHCTSVRPASSEVVFDDVRNSSSRSCFVITDTKIECHLIGSIGTGEILVRQQEFHEQFTVSRPIPEGGAIVGAFYVIQFSNGGLNGSTLKMNFNGADRHRDYDEVTQKSPIGSIGKGIVWEFERLEAEPRYPAKESMNLLPLWVSCLVVFVATPLLIGFVRARCANRSGKSESPHTLEQLFDSQAEVAVQSAPVSVDVQEDEPPTERVIPESPYESDSGFM